MSRGYSGIATSTFLCRGGDIAACLSCSSRYLSFYFFFFSSRRRHTRLQGDWSSDVCSSDLSRREFVASTAVGVAAAVAADIPYPMQPPRPLPPSSRWAAKPVALSSANGLRAVQKAFDMLMQGADTLDAVIEGVKIQELDPNDDSVGYGGLPNAAGVVPLDAACMHGPSKRAGAVGALEGIKTPSEVAKLVLKDTNHIFLLGEGAKRFALQYGFKDEDLLTEHA